MNEVKRRTLIFALYALVALLAAACGGGSHHHGGASGGSGQLTARSVDIYAACIRGHGVPNFYFTRKTPNSQVTSGIELGPWVASADPSSPQFQAASKACNHLFPGGPPGPVTEKQKEQLLQFAACMRVHGYPNYPDPLFPAGGGVEQQQPTGVDPNSPQFQAAVKTCNARS